MHKPIQNCSLILISVIEPEFSSSIRDQIKNFTFIDFLTIIDYSMRSWLASYKICFYYCSFTSIFAFSMNFVLHPCARVSLACRKSKNSSLLFVFTVFSCELIAAFPFHYSFSMSLVSKPLALIHSLSLLKNLRIRKVIHSAPARFEPVFEISDIFSLRFVYGYPQALKFTCLKFSIRKTAFFSLFEEII